MQFFSSNVDLTRQIRYFSIKPKDFFIDWRLLLYILRAIVCIKTDYLLLELF